MAKKKRRVCSDCHRHYVNPKYRKRYGSREKHWCEGVCGANGIIFEDCMRPDLHISEECKDFRKSCQSPHIDSEEEDLLATEQTKSVSGSKFDPESLAGTRKKARTLRSNSSSKKLKTSKAKEPVPKKPVPENPMKLTNRYHKQVERLSSRIEEHSAEIAKMLSSRDKLCEERKKTRKLLSTAIAKVQAQSSEASEREEEETRALRKRRPVVALYPANIALEPADDGLEDSSDDEVVVVSSTQPEYHSTSPVTPVFSSSQPEYSFRSSEKTLASKSQPEPLLYPFSTRVSKETRRTSFPATPYSAPSKPKSSDDIESSELTEEIADDWKEFGNSIMNSFSGRKREEKPE